MSSVESSLSGVLALLFSGVAFWLAFRLFKARPVLNRWNTVNGIVIERGTVVPTDPDLTVPFFRHAPLVRYEYQVNGQKYVNDRIYPKRLVAPARNTLTWAEKRANSFPNEILVHYNPANPSESFLENAPVSTVFLFFFAGFIPLLYGIMMLVTQ
jgi:hypothetical protein